MRLSIAHTRRLRIPAAFVALAALVVGCASGPAPPPPRLYRLPVALPAMQAPARPLSGDAVWQLMPVALPEYLQRDALIVPDGSARVRPLDGSRWAEPLRDAVPRLLKRDLAALLGADRVWTAPVPAGVSVTRELRLEISAFEPTADRSTVHLSARWSISSPLLQPAGAPPPAVGQADIDVPSTGPDADALVAAHRLALWQLARQIAQGAPIAPS